MKHLSIKKCTLTKISISSAFKKFKKVNCIYFILKQAPAESQRQLPSSPVEKGDYWPAHCTYNAGFLRGFPSKPLQGSSSSQGQQIIALLGKLISKSKGES